jgi:hypothetical protein
MTAGTIAAIRFFQTRTIYVSLPLIALLVFLGVFIFVGTLYGAGIIRGATYAGIMVALSVVFALVLIGTAGLYFFARTYR